MKKSSTGTGNKWVYQ